MALSFRNRPSNLGSGLMKKGSGLHDLNKAEHLSMKLEQLGDTLEHFVRSTASHTHRPSYCTAFILQPRQHSNSYSTQTDRPAFFQCCADIHGPRLDHGRPHDCIRSLARVPAETRGHTRSKGCRRCRACSTPFHPFSAPNTRKICAFGRSWSSYGLGQPPRPWYVIYRRGKR